MINVHNIKITNKLCILKSRDVIGVIKLRECIHGSCALHIWTHTGRTLGAIRLDG